MVYKGQRVIRYLYTWVKGQYKEIGVKDKVIIKTKDKILSGEIYSIGTKHLQLQVAPMIMYKPTNREGRVCSARCIKVEIDEIRRIGIYPSCSQRYGTINWY